MEAIKIYILEDEIITRRLLKKQLEGHGYVICGTSDNAEVAYEEIKELKPDVAILDIDVNGPKTGLWLGEQLDIPFIYLTAKSDSDTIKSAVKTKPVGYLIKPFKEMDVFAIVEMAMSQLSDKLSTPYQEETQQEVIIKDGRNHIKVKVDELYYIKSDGKYIEVHLKDKRIVSRQSLVGFASKLNTPSIFRIHGSYMINLTRIESYNTSFASLIGVDIPISRRYKGEFMKRMSH